MTTKLFLSLHVLAAILAIGPVTVAASAFPRYLRLAVAGDGSSARTILGALHRICRAYTVVGIAVPAFGLATAASLDVLTEAWLLTSIALTAIAAALLTLVVLPRQTAALVSLAPAAGAPALAAGIGAAAGHRMPVERMAARLGMVTGIFNLLWAIVVVLMIVRPGSTTGT